MSSVTIALDIMGGDHGPHAILQAAEKILVNHTHVKVVLFGKQRIIDDFINDLPVPLKTRTTGVYSTQVVLMSDKPTHALRHKKQSSMRLALESVQTGVAQACVSAGNTGALMAMSYYVLKCISGISRPALITSLPTHTKKRVLLLDLGASINCDAQALLEYAVMGSVLSETCLGVQNPKVRLLNVGEEEVKGSSLIQHADLLLKTSSSLNYQGYIEGNHLFSGIADVIVTDGFTGNVALKTSEGIAQFVIDEIKAATSETLFTRLVSRLLLPFLKKLYRRMNPDQYNGASLIGLRGIVVKSHGNASVDACYYAILQAVQEVEQSVPDKIKTKIENVLMEL